MVLFRIKVLVNNRKVNMITPPFKNRFVPVFLTLLRIVIGWHFLYEGLIKLLNPSWSARQFLESSRWIFGDLFRWMASGNTGMWIIDALNAYGLTLIGLALILGVFTRLASWSGVGLLLMYYLAYPPFGGYSFGAPSEGSYLIVNKNLIEIFALILLSLTDSGQFFGLDMLLKKRKIAIKERQYRQEKSDNNEINGRRELLKGLAGIPFLTLFGGAFARNLSVSTIDTVSGATVKVDYKQIKDIRGKLPEGKLGDLTLSRIVMGCNLIGGVAHARDLKYANKLFKAYNTDIKVLETLHLGEMAGINTTFMVNKFYPLFNRYLKLYGGKMQSICQTVLLSTDFLGDIDRAIGNGADTLYIQGDEGDRYVREGNISMLAKAIEHIKKQGFMAGMGAHSLEVVKACEKEGLPIDYYVKTFHNDNYWSAHPESERVEFSVDTKVFEDHNMIHDNIFDLFPVKTREFMKDVRKPWIAYKVLAGGAILPQDGFRFAFENGADFVCVGMFDFQVVDNVNTANVILGDLKKREREWFS
jgi:uncharacterized membrane protein YphA (DoxX/SURF4 family)